MVFGARVFIGIRRRLTLQRDLEAGDSIEIRHHRRVNSMETAFPDARPWVASICGTVHIRCPAAIPNTGTRYHATHTGHPPLSAQQDLRYGPEGLATHRSARRSAVGSGGPGVGTGHYVLLPLSSTSMAAALHCHSSVTTYWLTVMMIAAPPALPLYAGYPSRHRFCISPTTRTWSNWLGVGLGIRSV